MKRGAALAKGGASPALHRSWIDLNCGWVCAMGKVRLCHPGAGVFTIAGACEIGRLHHFNTPAQRQADHFAVSDEPARLVSGVCGPVAIVRSGPRRHDVGRRLCVVPIDWKS